MTRRRSVFRGGSRRSPASRRRSRRPGGPSHLSARRRAARRRGRVRAARWILGAAGAVLAVTLLAVLLPMSRAQAPVCMNEPDTFPASGIGGWHGEQLENAAIIMRTANGLGLGRDGQILGVMAAMGESTLRNIGYGDWETSRVTNPDGTPTSSLGLFQQQEWWGSAEARMEPATAASLFYSRLGRLDGWQGMARSHAIHLVQVNTNPDHYAAYEDDAIAVVDALSGPCPADG